MAGIETVSGACPNCGKAMYQKYESGNMGFMFDACFSCGYAVGESNNEDMPTIEIWKSILGHHGFSTISEFASGKEWLKGHEAGSDPEFPNPIFTLNEGEDLSKYIVDINLDVFK
jgi:hypothetical protein